MHADAVLAASPGDEDVKGWRNRFVERLAITEDVLLDAIEHSAENFDEKTLTDALEIIREENRERLNGMSVQTRETTDQLQLLFTQFSNVYREKSDTDPQYFFDELKAYHTRLTGRE